MRRALTSILALLVSVAVARADSVLKVEDGRASVEPAATIAAKSLTESSGLEFWQGAWWSLNDSGGAPVLYRSEQPDFKDARILAVPGAKNVDWEELTTLGDDLLVCDFGDNGQQRDDLKLYRISWNADTAKVETAATYPIAYPDGKHDAEAAFSIDEKLYVVSKNRREGFTAVYCFSDLKDGELNVGEKLGELEIDGRVQITAADIEGDQVVLLSYTHLFVYGTDKLTGKPKQTLRIYAAQCETLALHEGELVYGNEQGEIYRVEKFFERDLSALLPPPVTTELPFEKSEYEPDGSGEKWKTGAVELALQDLREGEYLRWMISGPWLMLAGRFEYGSFASSGAAGDRLGSGLMLMFSREGGDFVEDGDVHLWLGDNGVTGVDAWSIDIDKLGLTPMNGFKAMGEVADGNWYFEYAIPLTELFGEGKLPDAFHFNVWGYNLHGEDEPHLVGKSIFCFQNPFTWAKATITRPEDGQDEGAED